MPHQDGLFDSISGWMAHPFTQDMDLIEWGAFTVALVTIAFLWWRVLEGLYGEAD